MVLLLLLLLLLLVFGAGYFGGFGQEWAVWATMWYHRHLAAAEDFGDYAMPYGECALILNFNCLYQFKATN
jgi:hypothetical protein